MWTRIRSHVSGIKSKSIMFARLYPPKLFTIQHFEPVHIQIICRQHTNHGPNEKSFKLVQIQSTCRRQNNNDSKTEICVGKSRKDCVKKRKCWLPAFSPFPTIFSKPFFTRGVKSQDCVVMGQLFTK